VLATPIFFSPSSHADIWDSLWQRADQQGAKLLENGDSKAAANMFEDPQWKAFARYKDNNFAGANSALKDIDNPIANYNRGNALAKLGEYQAAIDAYQKVLDAEPSNEDAAFNKALIEKLLEQQKQQQQQQGENEQQQGANDQSQDSESNQGEQQSDDPSSQQRNDNNPGDQQNDQNNQDQQQNDQQNQQQNDQQQGREGEEQEQQSQASQSEEQQAEGQPQPFESLSDEEKQTMEQWMRQIPDDPGGLLRRKFRYQYEQRRRNGQEEVPETWY
jgi:Ca-activated chloride channel family protein